MFALGTWDNELIVGTYRALGVQGTRLNHLGRFDGVSWDNLGGGVNGPVRAVVEFGGSLVVGGDFNSAGAPARPSPGVAVFDGSTWRTLGAGLDGRVWGLCAFRGQLVAVGEFQRSGGRFVGHVARYDGTDWQPLGTATSTTTTPAVYCIATDGVDLYVGGSFQTIGGVNANHVARYDGSSWSGLGSGINSGGLATVWALTFHQSRLFAGGSFDFAGGTAADDVAAWNGQSWSAVGADLSNTTYGSDVRSLTSFGGDLYVAGSFNQISQVTPCHGIVRYDGQRYWPVGGPSRGESNPTTIFASMVWNNRLWCGGEFEALYQPGAAIDLDAVYHLASFDGQRWLGTSRGWGLDNEVFAVGTWRGRRIVAGRFSIAGGHTAAQLAVFDDDDWQALGGFDGPVRDLVEFNGDLYVAGEFVRVDGLTVNGVARWDGTRWSALGNGPTLSGCYAIEVFQNEVYVGCTGNPRRWNGAQWVSIGQPIYGYINALHAHGGALYVGGSTPFTAGAPNLFEWNGVSLTVVGGGTGDAVESLGSWGSDLIVGGDFTTAGGQPMQRITRWDGQAFHSIGNGLPGGTVASVCEFNGRLVAGGGFTSASGAAADFVAWFDGTTWRNLDASERLVGFVHALYPDNARGELHVGGWFRGTNLKASRNYAIWQEPRVATQLGQPLGSPRRPPLLTVFGTAHANSSLHLQLSSSREAAPYIWVLGLSQVGLPLVGGTLFPSPDAVGYAVTDAAGTGSLLITWRQGVPAIVAQAWVLDPSGPLGATATAGVHIQGR